MIEFLTSVGFKVFKSCGCNGGEAKWRHKDSEKMVGITIKTFRRGDHYEILRGGKVINRGMSHHLETEYNKLFNGNA